VAERIALISPIAAVYASPLERARETASPIAKRLGLRVKIERGLLECEFGEWTGKELKDSRSCQSGRPSNGTLRLSFPGR